MEDDNFKLMVEGPSHHQEKMKTRTSSMRLGLVSISRAKPVPAGVWGLAVGINTLVTELRKPRRASSMKVKLMPATAKGYSHSERLPSVLPRRRLNTCGCSCAPMLVFSGRKYSHPMWGPFSNVCRP